MIKRADKQDMEFVVAPFVVDGEPLNPLVTSWMIEIWSYACKRVVVQRIGGVVKSMGSINAACMPSNTDIRVYAKGSETPFGPGDLAAQFTLFSENDNFPGGVQVIKTVPCNIGIKIV